MVTIRDVAAHAGVSDRTVSHVLKGRSEHVSPETEARVKISIAVLKYRPNVAARYLRVARAHVLALAIPDLANAYFADVGKAVMAAAAIRSYTVLIDPTDSVRANEARVVNGLHPHLIDGVIIDPHALQIEDLDVQESSPPVVLVGEYLIGAPFDHVFVDNVAAARAATNHLISLGRRRIAAIGIPADGQRGSPILRLRGFTQALAEADLAPRPDYLAFAGVAWSRATGADAMRRLLALADPPDAVFCFNDTLALGAMAVLHQSGRHIPNDVAVIGYDDIEDGRYATPALSTIEPAKHNIGQCAVSMLMERIEGTYTGPPRQVELPFQLLARTSTIG